MRCMRSASRLLQSGLRYQTKHYKTPVFILQARGLATPSREWIFKSPYSDVEIPEISYPDYIFRTAEQNKDKLCMVNGLTGQTFSYGDLSQVCRRLGSGLTRLGLAKGDVLGLVSPNCPEFAITFLSVASLGAINTTVNCTYTADEIARQLENSGASMVLTHPLLLATIREACQLYKGVRHIIVNGPAEEGTISLQDLLQDNGDAFPNSVEINPKDDLIALPYSSGTTGVPKGVMLTHYNIVANLQQIVHPALNSTDKSAQDVFLGVLPFFHIYGMVPLLGLCFSTASKMVTLPMFDPKVYVSSIINHKVSYLHTVPPIVNFLTHSPAVKPEDLASVRVMVCGAAPVGKALLDEFLKKFDHGVIFQEGYGMTEASPVTHLTPLGKFVAGSTGPAIPNTTMKIVNLDTGATVGPGEGKGELCVKGPQVMKGYFRNVRATNDTIDEDGWLHTGDIAVLDDDLNVYIVDRLKELIKVKGLQVAPAELEDLLRTHPDVVDVAVIGIPHDRKGEVPRAYIVLGPNAAATEEDVFSFVEDRVAPHKKLAGGVIFTSEIPKSATGKILRRVLKEQALEEIRVAV